MASSSSSPWSWSSSFPSTGSLVIPEEDFKIFHTIDRKLFARMVFDLGRDPAESTQIMALWLWLEENRENTNMVNQILSYPDAIVDALSNEATLALNCIQSDIFPYDPDSTISCIPLIHHLTKSGVSLLYFYNNRLGLLRSIAKICNDICLRSFLDIIQQFQASKIASMGVAGEGIFSSTNPPSLRFGHLESNLSGENYYGRLMNPYVSVVYPNHHGGGGGYVHVMGVSPQNLQGDDHAFNSESIKYFDPYDLAAQRQVLTNEMSEMMNHLQLNSMEDKPREVPFDERTIFLTFSKGYPIFEDEIRDFFGRLFGDIIEAIHMQEVAQDEQPLYARLVTKTVTSIDVVLEERDKAKFLINGKHVWARKYVRNSTQCPGSSSGSQA